MKLFVISSNGMSSIGLASFGLSPSVGTGNGGNLTASEMVGELGILFVQSHHICGFAPLQLFLIFYVKQSDQALVPGMHSLLSSCS